MDEETFVKIINLLAERYGIQAPVHLDSLDPFKVLVGTVLSHRTRDEVTDLAFRRLFSKYKNVEEIANAPLDDITRLIKPVGFYKEKAKRIKEIAKLILERYGGQVPRSRELLMELPGVGYKTADIVLSVAYGEPIVAVDTHVETISKRLGIVGWNAKYEEIRKGIERITPPHMRRIVNRVLVTFGKEICRKPRPKCESCPITAYCEWYTKKTLSR
ncbi:MAG: endonuclease III [Nitrososphaerota archaeon]|nr:endonuclease III [Aigarchaeota archaeon]MDW8076474.1 endonuclease III [Nitrososphaerota archaeon]